MSDFEGAVSITGNIYLNWHTMSMHLLKRLLLIAIISTLSVSSPCQSPNQAGINLGYGIWDGLHAGAS